MYSNIENRADITFILFSHIWNRSEKTYICIWILRMGLKYVSRLLKNFVFLIFWGQYLLFYMIGFGDFSLYRMNRIRKFPYYWIMCHSIQRLYFIQHLGWLLSKWNLSFSYYYINLLPWNRLIGLLQVFLWVRIKLIVLLLYYTIFETELKQLIYTF